VIGIERAHRVAAVVWSLDTLPDVRDLITLLT
jgi:hypothetical protein